MTTIPTGPLSGAAGVASSSFASELGDDGIVPSLVSSSPPLRSDDRSRSPATGDVGDAHAVAPAAIAAHATHVTAEAIQRICVPDAMALAGCSSRSIGDGARPGDPQPGAGHWGVIRGREWSAARSDLGADTSRSMAAQRPML